MWAGQGEIGLPGKAQDWIGEVLERGNMSAVDGARKLGIGLGAEEVGPHFSTCSFKQPPHWLLSLLRHRTRETVSLVPSFSCPAVTMVGWAQVLKSGLHIALQAKDYVSGVRQSILAGGETTSRQELPAVPCLAMLRIPCRVELLVYIGVKEWRCGALVGPEVSASLAQLQDKLRCRRAYILKWPAHFAGRMWWVPC